MDRREKIRKLISLLLEEKPEYLRLQDELPAEKRDSGCYGAAACEYRWPYIRFRREDLRDVG